MASSTQILRQYLLSIGFSVDEKSSKTFDKEVVRLDKSAIALGKTMLGAAAAAQAMVYQFARGMEQMYYSSKKADSTVGNLQAIEFMGQQVGMSAGQMTASLEGMARQLRANPGLQGLLENLGVPVAGRDKADVMIDLVKALKGMPFYVAQQFGQLFGIDPDQLLLLEQAADELDKLRQTRKDMAAEMGVDSDKAAEAAREYMNSWRLINEQVGIFRDALAIALLPYMRELSTVTSAVLKDWTRIVQMTPDDFWSKFADGLRAMAGIRPGGNGSGVTLTAEARARLATLGLRPGENPGSMGAAGLSAVTTPGMWDDVDPSLLGRLEAQYGLPAGILDRMWNAESGRGRSMKSPKGARGHFGFMPQTQAELGLSDPNDFVESANAAARYLGMLKDRYGGDMQKATAAYNWGMGNLDRQGLGKAPFETRDYVKQLTGQPIQVQQTNQFNITAPSPEAAASAVERQLSVANRDMVRNISGAAE